MGTLTLPHVPLHTTAWLSELNPVGAGKELVGLEEEFGAKFLARLRRKRFAAMFERLCGSDARKQGLSLDD